MSDCLYDDMTMIMNTIIDEVVWSLMAKRTSSSVMMMQTDIQDTRCPLIYLGALLVYRIELGYCTSGWKERQPAINRTNHD